LRSINRVRNVVRRATRPLRLRSSGRVPSAVILTYHRVAQPASDAHALAVSPANFARHVQYLRKACHPLSLSALADGLARGDIPERGVVVTFDDGYVDNLRNAAPVLESAGVPATVFVTSGYMEDGRAFWWDRLEELLLVEPRAPEQASLCIEGREQRWPLASPEQRRRSHAEIHAALRPLGTDVIEAALADLARQLGFEPRVRDDCRPMDAGELRSLVESGLIEVGAHTRTHPLLPSLPPEAQRDEIGGAREALERAVGRPVRTHAHPFGAFDEHTVGILRDLGFEAACAGVADRVQAGCDRLRLPRHIVRDWKLATFRRVLGDYLQGEVPL
jgi:peptidoglycan/xylan/chitin deacetylase (PgdA/CDA1 family)